MPHMNKKRMYKSIRFKIVMFVLGIFIPLNVLILLLTNALMKDMEQHVFKSEENALKMYRNQIEIYFDAMEQYLSGILMDSAWNGLNFERENQDYIMTKNRLWNKLVSNMEEYPLAGAFYIHIKTSDERLFARNVEKLTLEEAEDVKACISDSVGQRVWDILVCKSGNYVVKSFSNSYMQISVAVKETDLLNLWDSEGADLILLSDILTIHQRELYPGSYFGLEEESEQFYVLCEPYTSASFSIVRLIPQYDIKTRIFYGYRLLLYLSLIGLIAVPFIYLVLERILLRPLREIEAAILKIKQGNISYRITKFGYSVEFQNIMRSFNRMLDQIVDLEKKTYDLEIEKKEAQLDSLRLQINPHLLLNSLNTVYSLAQMKKYDGIQTYVLNLVKYFRYSLRNTEEYVQLGKEIDFIKCYLEIQRIRYPGRFYALYNIDEELSAEPVPPLIIENFVENSSKYAWEEDRPIEIVITVKADGHFLRISVSDNGKGIEETILNKIKAEQIIEDSRGRHIGIYNCVKRLRLFYGEAAIFSVASRPGEGTQVWMKIPRKEQHFDELVDSRR